MKTLSLYTQWFDKDGSWYLYNAQTNFFSEVSQELIDTLEDREWDSIPDDVMNKLKEQHIIEESSALYDYYNKMKIVFEAGCYNPTSFKLVIAPTTSCNFACPYCFEPKKNVKTITDNVIERLVDFLKKKEHLKDISIVWYGGEPLIAFNKIKQILERFESENITVWSQSIITNGYLLTPEICEYFKNRNLSDIQITLDGNRDSHNSTRFLKHSGEGSFDVVFNNIITAVKALPNSRINVRVNVNKNNYLDYADVVNLLRQELPGYENFSAYPGLIREETSDKRSLKCSSYKTSDIHDLYSKYANLGISFNLFPKRLYKRCMMQDANAYVVGPEGELYKCWNDVSDPSKVVGNIADEHPTNDTLLTNYMTLSSPFNEECKQCKVFPICDGGCSLHRYRNNLEGCLYDVCSPYKDKNRLKDALINGTMANAPKC